MLTKKEFLNYNWWYYDGSQPISNGGHGIVIDCETSEIAYIITCSGNDGHYEIISWEELNKSHQDYIKNMNDVKS